MIFAGLYRVFETSSVNFTNNLFSCRNTRYIKSSAIDWLIRNDFVKMSCKNIVISLMIFASQNWSIQVISNICTSEVMTQKLKIKIFQVPFFMAILKRAPCIYARQSWRAAEAVVSSSQCVADKWIKFPGNHRFGQQFGHFYCSKNPLFSVERQLLSM